MLYLRLKGAKEGVTELHEFPSQLDFARGGRWALWAIEQSQEQVFEKFPKKADAGAWFLKSDDDGQHVWVDGVKADGEYTHFGTPQYRDADELREASDKQRAYNKILEERAKDKFRRPRVEDY